MNAQMLDLAVSKVMDKTGWSEKRAHKMVAVVLAGEKCKECSDEGFVFINDEYVDCPVCGAVEDVRQ